MNKKIFIHVGPPKTGSSAIQKWFNENVKTVKSLGIYYPEHQSDPNGISSGNLYAIYDKNSEGNYSINLNKVSKLISDFEESKFQYLLLSSEFFFQRMEDIKKHFPEASFIAYLRAPMDKRESLYNQGIKRHHVTQPFPQKINRKFNDLEKINSFISLYDNEVMLLRFYGSKYFFKKNIISDILKTIGIEKEVSSDIINSSYQFEALEFKRWLNNYPLGLTASKIDIALQNYKNTPLKFSLLPSEMCVKQRKVYQSLYKKFLANKKLPHSDIFLSELITKPAKPYKKQLLTEREFTHVCNYLLKAVGADLSKVRTTVEASELSNNLYYKKLFLKIVPKEITKLSKVKEVINFILIRSRLFQDIKNK